MQPVKKKMFENVQRSHHGSKQFYCARLVTFESQCAVCLASASSANTGTSGSCDWLGFLFEDVQPRGCHYSLEYFTVHTAVQGSNKEGDSHCDKGARIPCADARGKKTKQWMKRYHMVPSLKCWYRSQESFVAVVFLVKVNY
jgi:hypothetical protein